MSDEDRGKLVVRLRDSANFMLKAADAEGWSATDLTRGISHLALQAATEIEDARALLRDAAALFYRVLGADDDGPKLTADMEGWLSRIEGGASS